MADGNSGHETEVVKQDSHESGMPDHDAIRMFVGQIPRQWTETELRDLFAEYGKVYQLIILKEKGTGANRGCCFVTYYTRRAALEAQIALHSVRILPGMKHPIQMKPADNDPTKNAEERKLFIGMVSRKSSEEDVRKLFSSYGTIEECIILRDGQGKSKGCAFIQFSTRQSCINAIRGLNRSLVMEGCSAPITVKFAETAKQKEMKKMSVQQQSIGMRNQFGFSASSGNFGSSTGSGYFSGQLTNTASSTGGGLMPQNFGNNQPQNTTASDLQQQLTLMALTAAANQNQGANPMSPMQTTMPNLSGLNTLSPQVLQALAILLQQNQPQQVIFSAVSTVVNALVSANAAALNNVGGGFNTNNFTPTAVGNEGINMGSGGNSGTNQLASLLAAFQQTQQQQQQQQQQQAVAPQMQLPNNNQQVNTSFGDMNQQSNNSASSNEAVDSFTQAFLQGVNQYAQSQAANQFGNNNNPGMSSLDGGSAKRSRWSKSGHV